MAHQIPTKIPTRIVAGDTVKWNIDLSDYPASEGWEYTVDCRGDQGIATITATTTDDTYNIVVPRTTSADWKPGFYYYQAYIALDDDDHDDEGFSVDAGFFEVVKDLKTASGAHDGRSKYKQALDASDNALVTQAGKTKIQMQIAGQMVTLRSYEELIMFNSFARTQYDAEQAEVAREKGEKNGRVVGVKFVAN